MIKVNLTPDEELVNPLWWVPEVACALILCLAAFGGVFYYLGQLKQQIADTQIEVDALNASAELLQPDIKKYDEIVAEKTKLISKVNGLRAITMSKVKRYRPLILLEHLQNLKPEGVWFTSVQMLRDGAAAPAPQNVPPQQQNAQAQGQSGQPAPAAAPVERDDVAIDGAAFDNLLVAEFMSTLKATQAQEVDPKDLRTQVYFEAVSLAQTTSTTTQAGTFNDGNLGAQTAAIAYPIVNFSLKVKYREREVVAPTNVNLSLKYDRKSNRAVRK